MEMGPCLRGYCEATDKQSPNVYLGHSRPSVKADRRCDLSPLVRVQRVLAEVGQEGPGWMVACP